MSNHKITKRIVVSLGGSIVVPEDIDVKFVKKFKELINSLLRQGFSFILVTGGGRTCRKYQKALRDIGSVSKNDLDWMGIKATRLNGELIKLVFQKSAYQEIVTNPEKVSGNIKDKIIVAAGWKPGWSTDYMAVKLAAKFKAKTVINLSNIDYVYDKDPKKFKDAKPIHEATWKEFKKLVGGKWTPGANLPFDPIASKLAEKEKIEVAIMNGRKMVNLRNFLEGRKFVGSVISH